MYIDNKRLYQQVRAVDIWYNDYLGRGTVVATYGFGKTRVGKYAANRIIEKENAKKIIVLVHNEDRVYDWKIELKSVIDKNSNVIFVETFNKTINYFLSNPNSSINCDLLIIDEIHKLSTVDRVRLADSNWIKYKFILGLTATVPETGLAKECINKFCPVVHVISEELSIEKNFTSDYIEYNYGVELTDDERKDYDECDSIMKEIYMKFACDDSFYASLIKVKNVFDLINACYTGVAYKNYDGKWRVIDKEYYIEKLSEYKGWRKDKAIVTQIDKDIHEHYSPSAIFETAKKYNIVMRRRNDIINNAKNKMKASLEIVKLFRDSKIIIFGESTDMADNTANLINMTLGEKIGFSPKLAMAGYNNELYRPIALSYHSNVKSKPVYDEETKDFIRYKTGSKKGRVKLFGSSYFKKQAIEAIKSGEIKILCTARALDEGFNVEDLEIAIIQSGSRNPIQHGQRTGRVKRISFNKDRAIIVNLYCKDTHDEKKLLVRQKTNPKKIKTITNLNELL